MKTMTIITTRRAANAFQPETEITVNGYTVDYAAYTAIVRNYAPVHVGHVVSGYNGYNVEYDAYMF